MTKEELKKLKGTIAYFGHWYDVIGEERVSILEKSIDYIEELENENAELKEKLEKETDHRIRNFNKSIEWKEKHRKQKDQLAQAKEIIEELYDKIPASHSDYYKEVMEKAKQFLWGKE